MQIAELQAWLQARLSAPFAAQPPEIRIFADEVVIILQAEHAPVAGDDQRRDEAEMAVIVRQREETRPLRMQLANDLQPLLGKSVAWGMRVGESEVLFTTRTVPVMTRLGRAEREVLDTLVAAGVAETRSGALAYTVRAFATQHAAWLAEIRQAITQVQQIRSRLRITPRSGAPTVPDMVSHMRDTDEDSEESEDV